MSKLNWSRDRSDSPSKTLQTSENEAGNQNGNSPAISRFFLRILIYQQHFETYFFGEELVTGFLGLSVHASSQVVEIVALLDNLRAVEVIAKPQGLETGPVLVKQPGTNIPVKLMISWCGLYQLDFRFSRRRI
jgi:hypothetical protein